MKQRLFLLLAAVLLGSSVAFAERTTAPENAEVYFISPKAGEQVASPITVRFGLRGLGVAPAGTNIPNTGHHHLLINLDELPSMDAPLPATEQIVHFGGGQTETEVSLPKGTHTLQLLVGDKNHIPHEPPIISEKITITVD